MLVAKTLKSKLFDDLTTVHNINYMILKFEQVKFYVAKRNSTINCVIIV